MWSSPGLRREVLAVRGFGELESAIMELMWTLGHPVTVRAVYDLLHEHRDSAYTTVMTVMTVLHRKGWLRREHTTGRVWEYEPTVTRERYLAGLMRQALDEAHNREAVFACFARQLTAHERHLLKTALGE